MTQTKTEKALAQTRKALEQAMFALGHAGGNITIDAFKIEGLNDYQRTEIRKAWKTARTVLTLTQPR